MALRNFYPLPCFHHTRGDLGIVKRAKLLFPRKELCRQCFVTGLVLQLEMCPKCLHTAKFVSSSLQEKAQLTGMRRREEK